MPVLDIFDSDIFLTFHGLDFVFFFETYFLEIGTYSEIFSFLKAIIIFYVYIILFVIQMIFTIISHTNFEHLKSETKFLRGIFEKSYMWDCFSSSN